MVSYVASCTLTPENAEKIDRLPKGKRSTIINEALKKYFSLEEKKEPEIVKQEQKPPQTKPIDPVKILKVFLNPISKEESKQQLTEEEIKFVCEVLIPKAYIHKHPNGLYHITEDKGKSYLQQKTKESQ